jgi:hypothetical protein
MQQDYIKILMDQYSHKIKLIETPLFPQEIKGLERIGRISEILFKPS